MRALVSASDGSRLGGKEGVAERAFAGIRAASWVTSGFAVVVVAVAAERP